MDNPEKTKAMAQDKMLEKAAVARSKKSKRSALRILSWMLAVALVAAIAYYVRKDRALFARLALVSPPNLAILFGIWIVRTILPGLGRKVMIARFGEELAFVDWYGLSMVTNLISLVVPSRGDLFVSATYLKKKYNLPITHFVSTIYGSAVLLAAILCIEGGLALLLLGITQHVWDPRIWGIVIALGIGTIPFALFPQRILKGESWPVRKLRAAIEGWEKLRTDLDLLIILAALSVLDSVIFATWMYASYRALGFEVGIIPVFFAGVATQMSFFFALTPGNLGVREAVVGFVSQVTGLGFAEGVAVTILQRAVVTVGLLVLGGFFSWFILPELVRSADKRA